MGDTTKRKIAAGSGLAAIAMICFGCATARVQNVQADRMQPLPRPARVLVYDFYTGSGDVRVGRSPRRTARRAVGLSVDEPDLLAQAVAYSLATRLVEDIRAIGLAAERAAGAAPPAMNDLVVQGQFLRIDEGSQAKRFVIGFGVGATELKTQTEVFQVTADGWRPVKQFETLATGSRFPGAGVFVAGGGIAGTAATSAMISGGIGTLRELRASIDADAGRTSAQIAHTLSELAAAQRW